MKTNDSTLEFHYIGDTTVKLVRDGKTWARIDQSNGNCWMCHLQGTAYEHDIPMPQDMATLWLTNQVLNAALTR